MKKCFYKIAKTIGFKVTDPEECRLEGAIETHSGEGSTKEMLQNVMMFNKLDVEDVMTPRTDVISVDHDISFGDLKKFISEEVHTRIPVCNKTLDDIVGFFHIKDLVTILCKENNEPFNIDKIMRQALFVPPSMKINNLLLKMQLSHVHIALVVDEFGGTSGLITMEDLMEEIVGEIEDEHDKTDNVMCKKLEEGLFEASARIDIEDLEKRLELKLIEEGEAKEFDTLGGLIFFILGRVPATGELATHKVNNKELEFEITDADLRRIKRVLIRKK